MSHSERIACLCFAVFGACRPPLAATEVVVEVDSAISSSRLLSVLVKVTPGADRAGTPLFATACTLVDGSAGSVALPLVLGLGLDGMDATPGPFTVVATGFQDRSCETVLIAQSATVQFALQQSLLVRLQFIDPCIGIVCKEGQTCLDASHTCEGDGRTALPAFIPNCGGTCPGGWLCCGTMCIDPNNDVDNCGACDNSCVLANAVAQCSNGVCAVASCKPGFNDCDHLAADGCEADFTSDPKACGGCGKVCSNDHVPAPTCAASVCTGACSPGYVDCNNNLLADGCEIDTRSDALNCGGCGNACSTMNVLNSTCGMDLCNGACATGYADCNGDKLSDGCEVDLNSDGNNCGKCGNPCASVWCKAGACCTLFPKAAAYYTVGMNPIAAAVGDFNGDGKLDLVIANEGGLDLNKGVSVLLNLGNGTFASAANYYAGQGRSPFSVAVGDFNGDGKPDLAVMSRQLDGTIGILMNLGDGTFAMAVDYPVGMDPFSVVVGDFNGDNKPDLAVANEASATVGVLLNQGGGLFGGMVNYPVVNPLSLAVGDFNGDGKADLVVGQASQMGTGPVGILLNQGAGAFGPVHEYPAGGENLSVAVGDFDGDGKPDVAIANNGGGKPGGYVSLLFNKGNGNFGAAVDYVVGSRVNPVSVVAADFNGDGKLDLAVQGAVLLNQGNGTLAGAGSYLLLTGASAVGDFDGNGTPDLAGPSDQTHVAVLLNGGVMCK